MSHTSTKVLLLCSILMVLYTLESFLEHNVAFAERGAASAQSEVDRLAQLSQLQGQLSERLGVLTEQYGDLMQKQKEYTRIMSKYPKGMIKGLKETMQATEGEYQQALKRFQDLLSQQRRGMLSKTDGRLDSATAALVEFDKLRIQAASNYHDAFNKLNKATDELHKATEMQARLSRVLAAEQMHYKDLKVAVAAAEKTSTLVLAFPELARRDSRRAASAGHVVQRSPLYSQAGNTERGNPKSSLSSLDQRTTSSRRRIEAEASKQRSSSKHSSRSRSLYQVVVRGQGRRAVSSEQSSRLPQVIQRAAAKRPSEKYAASPRGRKFVDSRWPREQKPGLMFKPEPYSRQTYVARDAASKQAEHLELRSWPKRFVSSFRKRPWRF